MRKYLVTTLSVLLLTFGLPTTSNAATDGCPDSWVIDTTQYPNQELINAKKRLGVNMAETNNVKVVEFKGPLGTMPPDSGLIGYSGINPLSYLYYDSKIQTNIKVEVKDCLNSAYFNFESNWINKEKYVFTLTTATEFANQVPEVFSDFKMQQAFGESITQLENKMKEMVNVQIKNGISRIRFEFIDASYPTAYRGINFGRIKLYTFALTPKCLILNPNTSRFEIMTNINDCKFAIGIFTSTTSKNTIYLLDPFTLKYALNYSITCIKGKTTKKVSGTNPKCPKGYKVKA